MRRATAAWIFACWVVFLVGCASPTPRSDQALPSVDMASPDFTLKTTSGSDVTLSQKVSEGPVVLVFYRGHW